MGEVDYTKGRIIKITAYSANGNITININDLNRSYSLKGTRTIATVHFQETDLTKGFNHSRGPLVIKKSTGTGVPLSKFTAFFQLVEFADLNVLVVRTDTAAMVHFLPCAFTARISHWFKF